MKTLLEHETEKIDPFKVCLCHGNECVSGNPKSATSERSSEYSFPFSWRNRAQLKMDGDVASFSFRFFSISLSNPLFFRAFNFV